MNDWEDSCPEAAQFSKFNSNKIANSLYNPEIGSTDKKLKLLGFDPKKLFNKSKWDLASIFTLFDVLKAHKWEFGTHFGSMN